MKEHAKEETNEKDDSGALAPGTGRGAGAWRGEALGGGEGTELKAEQSVSAAKVAELPVGAELTLVEGAGRWLKVQSADGKKDGSTPAASPTPNRSPRWEGAKGSSAIRCRKARSTRPRPTAPAASRPLSRVAQYAKQRGTPEALKKELDKILKRKVSDKEVRTFLKEGKIGEYAQ